MSSGAASLAWLNQAECQGASDEIFFMGEGEHMKPGRFTVAAGYCARCPVFFQCDEFTKNERYGFSAGRLKGQ